MHRTAALLITALALIGCQAASPTGMDARKLAEIPVKMRELMAQDRISGAVTMVLRHGQLAEFDAVGMASLEAQRPMTTGTMFWIASMTKPITATAMMILADEGRISVEDPVSKYVPEFAHIHLKDGSKPKSPVTLRQVISHTSGVAKPKIDPAKNPNPTLAQTVAAMADQPLDFEPGTQWKYSTGPDVIGRVIEVASGMSYETFLQRRIFDPLGMKDTTFYPDAVQRSRLAVVYKPGPGGKGLEATYPTFVQPDSPVRRAPFPSGGLASTAADLRRFYTMIMNNGELDGHRILSAAAVKQMTTAFTGDVPGFLPGSAWALGWATVKEPTGITAPLSAGTFGHGGAFGTQFWIDRKKDLILVLLIARTGFGSSDASEVREAFQRLAVDAIAE